MNVVDRVAICLSVRSGVRAKVRVMARVKG